MNSFGNRLYELRKQKGLSQEALAEKLNVTRQTVSKWELGESTPDMERLLALSTLFDISLDELMLGSETKQEAKETRTVAEVLDEKILTESNKKKAKSLLKLFGIILGAVFAVDVISFILYFCLHGAP